VAAAIKRIIRDERRRRGEPVSEMEAPGATARTAGSIDVRVSARATEETLRGFARAKRPAVWRRADWVLELIVVALLLFAYDHQIPKMRGRQGRLRSAVGSSASAGWWRESR
jgi:hypothetical protein